MSTKLFDGKELTPGEEEFISNVLKDNKTYDASKVYLLKAQTVATLRLAKEIEESNKSSKNTAVALNWLTFALFAVGVIQVLISLKVLH